MIVFSIVQFILTKHWLSSFIRLLAIPQVLLHLQLLHPHHLTQPSRFLKLFLVRLHLLMDFLLPLLRILLLALLLPLLPRGLLTPQILPRLRLCQHSHPHRSLLSDRFQLKCHLHHLLPVLRHRLPIPQALQHSPRNPLSSISCYLVLSLFQVVLFS